MQEDNNFYHPTPEVFSHDITDIRGYGETKEEALKNFKDKLDWLFREYETLERLIFNTDNIVEVDCFGKEIK